MKSKTLLALICAAAVCSACDDGRIEEKKVDFKGGRSVTVKAELKGALSWHERYSLAVAGFNETSDYAEISKVIEPSSDDMELDITLSGIDTDVTHVDLCMINRLRKRIVTFRRIEIEKDKEQQESNLGTIYVGMFTAIQDNIFSTTCAACHGATGNAAASLFLTEGKSRESLVGIQSKKVPTLNRVTPGDSPNSVLYQTISGDISSTWHYNHSAEITSADMKSLIADWIDNGAK